MEYLSQNKREDDQHLNILLWSELYVITNIKVGCILDGLKYDWSLYDWTEG